MRVRHFRKWLIGLPAQNILQRLHTLAALHSPAGPDQFIALIDLVGAATRCCPSCTCKQYHRHGQANGLKRYRCRACGRTYNDLSGTPLARLRMREKWLDYLRCMRESKSVRAAAAQLEIHRNTSFRWRHRFRERPGQERLDRLPGIAVADANSACATA